MTPLLGHDTTINRCRRVHWLAGSHGLSETGHRVAALDNFSDAYSPECKHRNLIPLLTHPNFELHRADITNGTALQSFVGETRPDTIVHLAARPGVRDSFGEPRSYFENNVTGTINVLESAVQARVRKVVFASSSSVYGNAPAPFQESGPTLPVSPYALSKLTGEELCRLYSRLYGLQIICLRLFTVYGPRQRPDMAIRKFAERMISGTPIDVYGAGDSRRDYTYVDDVLAGLLASVEYNANFEVFNLGGSTPTSLKDMIDTLAARLNVTPIIHRLPSQVGDPDLTCADISKAKHLLGYEPKTNFASGIDQFVSWLLAEPTSAVQRFHQDDNCPRYQRPTPGELTATTGRLTN